MLKENVYLLKNTIQTIKETLHIEDALIDELMAIQDDDITLFEKTIRADYAHSEMNNIIQEITETIAQEKSCSDIIKFLEGDYSVFTKEEENFVRLFGDLEKDALSDFVQNRATLYTLRKNVWVILSDMYNDAEIQSKKIPEEEYKTLMQYFLDNYSYKDSLKLKGYYLENGCIEAIGNV